MLSIWREQETHKHSFTPSNTQLPQTHNICVTQFFLPQNSYSFYKFILYIFPRICVENGAWGWVFWAHITVMIGCEWFREQVFVWHVVIL